MTPTPPAETQESVGTDASTCGKTSCDPEDALNLTGDCHNSCLGIDGCGTCVPVCVCIEGYQKDENDVCQLVDQPPAE